MGDVKFGVMLPVMVPSGPRPRSLYHALQYRYRKLDIEAVRDATIAADRLGYHSVWVSDHLSRGACRERLECWTTMSWLASITERVRLGSMVLCSLFRHPSLLAKMASTLDVLSGGRLEFGIGACWSEDEFTDGGMDWPEPGARLRMMRETVEICKSLWTRERTTYEGRYYRTRGAYNEPKPLQKPHPPILIGGSGERLTLRIVARHADMSNFGGPVENVRRKMEILRKDCDKIRRDYETIEKTSNIAVVIHPNEEDYLEDMKKRHRAEGSPRPFDEWLEMAEASYIAGTPEDCVERLQPYVDLGVTLFVIRFGDVPGTEGMRLFAEEVAPKISG